MSHEMRNLRFAVHSITQALLTTSILLAMSVVGCAAKMTYTQGPMNPYGADYTTVYPSGKYVPVMFKFDKDWAVFAAARGHVLPLNKNATVYYFRPREANISDTSLNSQVQIIWSHFERILPTGDLDILILRCMPHNPTTVDYSYVFVKDSKGQWARVRDRDYLDRIVESQL